MKQERSYGAIIISLHPEWWERMKEYIRAISLLEVGMKKEPQSWCYLGG